MVQLVGRQVWVFPEGHALAVGWPVRGRHERGPAGINGAGRRTMHRRCYCRLTDAGRKIAAARRLPTEIEGLPDPSDAHEVAYVEHLRNAIRVLNASTAPGREI